MQTGVQEQADDERDIEEFTSIIQYFLLAFGFIALFVGAFVIFNTLSITVAQRVREFATLQDDRGVATADSRLGRPGGARDRALASVVGLFLGLGLAAGLSAIFTARRLRPAAGGTRLRRRGR